MRMSKAERKRARVDRDRAQWNSVLDRGKTKKIKWKEDFVVVEPKKNPFQKKGEMLKRKSDAKRRWEAKRNAAAREEEEEGGERAYDEDEEGGGINTDAWKERARRGLGEKRKRR